MGRQPVLCGWLPRSERPGRAGAFGCGLCCDNEYQGKRRAERRCRAGEYNCHPLGGLSAMLPAAVGMFAAAFHASQIPRG